MRYENSGATGFQRKINNTLVEQTTAAGSYTAGQVLAKTPITADATATKTITGAELLGGHLQCTVTSGAAGWTTPTAALLVAAATQVGNPPRAGETANGSFDLLIRNTGNQTLTLTAGTNCTLTEANHDTITSGKSLVYHVQIVTATVGSEAYSMFPKGNAYTP